MLIIYSSSYRDSEVKAGVARRMRTFRHLGMCLQVVAKIDQTDGLDIPERERCNGRFELEG